MKSLNGPNKDCTPSKEGNAGAIIHHGFYRTKWRQRRRYQCQACGKTFCSTTGTAYYRLQHRRNTLDEVASLRVEGLNKSAIARVKKSPGIRYIAGWKEQTPGVADSMIEE